MPDVAVIFDVDGPLLDLTTAEEDMFFAPLISHYGLTNINRDWDSYRIRNDEDIYAEILHDLLGRLPSDNEIATALQQYATAMQAGFDAGTLQVSPIPGARNLLAHLAQHGDMALGIATANTRAAAHIRLQQADMWQFIHHHPGAANGGGPKRDVLARVIAGLKLEPQRIVFLGDNLNDLDAAQHNNTHFIGFHTKQAKRQRLKTAGAVHLSGNHDDTLKLIIDLLALT